MLNLLFGAILLIFGALMVLGNPAESMAEREDIETTPKSPKLSPIIPAGFQGTWTTNPTGLHPAEGEEPWLLAAKTFQAHEAYADVRFVIIHGGDAITLILDVSSEGERFTEEKYFKLSQNGNRLEMKRTGESESGLFLHRVTSLAKDKLKSEKYTRSRQGGITPTEARKIDGYNPWSEKVIEAARDIPVQDGGRIKPLSTFARFQMLSYHGAVTMKIKSGGKKRTITPTEWLLDCIFRPELANELPIFRIDDSEVLHRYGIGPKDRRARLSFNDLLDDYGKGPGGKDRLLKGGKEIVEKRSKEERERKSMTPNQIEAMEASEKEEEKEEKRKEKLIMEFAQQVLNYEAMTKFLDFGRIELSIPDFPDELFKDEGRDPKKFSTWISRWNQLRAIFIMSSQQGIPVPDEVESLAREIELILNSSRWGVRWYPPYEKDENEWQSIGNRIITILEKQDFPWDTIDDEVKELEALDGEEVPERLKMASFWNELMGDMATMETLIAASKAPNSSEFLKALESWKDEVTARAKGRIEGSEDFKKLKDAKAAAGKPIPIYKPTPKYPPAARRLGQQGTATLFFTIGSSGTVISARITKSSGYTLLDNAALSAIRSWRFKPARNALGEAVNYSYKISTPFRLR